MDKLFGNLFLCAVFAGAVIFLLIIAAKKAGERRSETESVEEAETTVDEEFPTEQIRATVAELNCCSKMIGIKTPKAVREFTVTLA